MIMNTKDKGVVNFLIYRDSSDSQYTAVCLTFDIVEQGENIEELKKSIQEAAALHIESVLANGLSNNLLNRSAPQKYWKKLYDAMTAYDKMLKRQEEVITYEEPSVSDIWNRSRKELAAAAA